MIACNPRVYIESGNGTVETVRAINEEGYGIMFVNTADKPYEIGEEVPVREDFNPEEAAVTWVFKNVASLNVLINNLIRIRCDMEDYENGKLNKEEPTNE